ncbi:MAG: hypothetical protein CFE44_13600 [Burkholderiales bacterium PBB4]|nr:MAG: hypothetical protein CFE44_13600 [Burkholderiales bacterium PBB4]
MGKHLVEAQTLLNEKKYQQSKEKLQLAEAMPEKSPYENYLITLLSLNVAVNEDDAPTSAKLMDAMLNLNESGKWASKTDIIAMMQIVGVVQYRAKNYAQAALWMERNLKEGGTNSSVKNVRIHANLLANDFQRATELAEEEIALSQKESRAPAQPYLEILAQARGQVKDVAGSTRAVELLVTHYPKKEFWQSLVNRLWARPDLNTALHLDVFRLGFQVGALQETSDFIEYIEFAQRAGFSTEAIHAYDKGAEAGLLGTGDQADAHKKLRAKLAAETEQDKKTSAADIANALKKPNGIAMLNLGYGLVNQGQFDKGIELMEKGIAKGLPKRPEDARLHLGIAYALAGQPDKAKQIFATVSGKEGLDELARYWTLAIRKP